jgi:hypothetical protein
MLSNNVLSFLILAAVGLSLIYLIRKGTSGQTANNDGVMTMRGQNSYGGNRTDLGDQLSQQLGLGDSAAAALDASTPAISSACRNMATLPMGKQLCQEQVENIVGPNCQTMSNCGADCDYRLMKINNNILPYPQVSSNYAPQTAVNQQFSNTINAVSGCVGGRDVLSSTDLLPREDGFNVWQATNPQSQGALTDQNFLEAGHHFGINTVGQSLKNPNLQLRSDPIIPKRDIGPFLQSTFEPDTNRRFFEIGQC